MTYRNRQTADYSAVPCNLPFLIAHNAPLDSGSLLVLLYERLQLQMTPSDRQGVGIWLKECVDKHGLPSLLRFGRRDRATVYRKDEFAPWFAPLMNKKEA